MDAPAARGRPAISTAKLWLQAGGNQKPPGAISNPAYFPVCNAEVLRVVTCTCAIECGIPMMMNAVTSYSCSRRSVRNEV